MAQLSRRGVDYRDETRMTGLVRSPRDPRSLPGIVLVDDAGLAGITCNRVVGKHSTLQRQYARTVQGR